MLRIRTFATVFCAFALSAAITSAQPLGATYAAIEAEIAEADHVVLATISDLSPKVLVERGGINEYGSTDPNGKVEYTVTLKIKETFKGKLKGVVTDLQPVPTLGFDIRFDQWKSANTVFFCYLGPDPKPGEKRTWRYQALGPRVENEEMFVQREFAPMLGQDLSVLKTEAEIFARAIEYGPISDREKLSGAPATISLRVPGELMRDMPRADFYSVVLPVNAALETLAHRMIKTPQEMIQDNLGNDLAGYQLKMAGIKCLRYFNSESNVALLKELMDEAPNTFESDSNFKPSRIEAMETLLRWGVQFDLPYFWKEITRLDLSGSQVNDESLVLVGKLDSLTELDLLGTNLSRDALMQLNGLKRLSMIEISNDQLSDSNVQALNEMGLLHSISVATTIKDKRRPVSPDDVHSLGLWVSPITDAGLKEFSEFKNVAYVDLRKTRVTDAGLVHLNQMKQLKYLHLDKSLVTDAGLQKLTAFAELEKLGLGNLPITDKGLKHLAGLTKLNYLRVRETKVTPEGIAEFQKALPECEIASSFNKKY